MSPVLMGEVRLNQLPSAPTSLPCLSLLSCLLPTGTEWVDPEDPTVIAENELLGAAAAIEAAAKKLEQLKPRAKPKVRAAPPFHLSQGRERGLHLCPFSFRLPHSPPLCNLLPTGGR